MADSAPTPRKQSLQMAGVIAGALVAIDVVFWVMSGLYYKDKPDQIASIDSVRIAFLIMSFIIAGTAYAAVLAPRLVGHVLAWIVGAASIVGGVLSLGKGLPVVLGVTLMVLGGLIATLGRMSQKQSRPAWAFLIAVLAVMATVTFFGAPKIRNVMGIGLWHTMIIPGLLVVSVMALSMVRGEYRNS